MQNKGILISVSSGNKTFVYTRDGDDSISMVVNDKDKKHFYNNLESMPKPDKVDFIQTLFNVNLTHKELLDVAITGIVYCAGGVRINEIAVHRMMEITPIECLPIVDSIMKQSMARLENPSDAMVYIIQKYEIPFELPEIQEIVAREKAIEKVAAQTAMKQIRAAQRRQYESANVNYVNTRGYRNEFYGRIMHVRNRKR